MIVSSLLLLPALTLWLSAPLLTHSQSPHEAIEDLRHIMLRPPDNSVTLPTPTNPTVTTPTTTPTCDCDAIIHRLELLEEKMAALNDEEDLGHDSNCPASSCAEILSENPSSPSGYYWISDSTGQPQRVYCAMTSSPCDDEGGWMRVAYLNMSKPCQQCPDGLIQRTDGEARTCVPSSDLPSCSSVHYQTHGVTYTKVCGRVRGYHIGTLDGFLSRPSSENYVDGVSLTHGATNNRQHIWSFAARVWCPCGSPPPFVGNDYFCDGASAPFGVINLSHPLWDGQYSSNTCCSPNPWFHRQLPQSSSDDVEMRLCRGQRRQDEDIAVGEVEIYVK